MHGDVELVVNILSTGRPVDVELRMPGGGWTPLMHAVEREHAGVVKVLLDKGAKASTATDDGYTALHFCARRGNLAIAKMLVSAGADLVAATSTARTGSADDDLEITVGSTPLHMAAEEGHSEFITALIEAGASPNSRTREGDSPLYTSCENARLGAVRALLRANADPLLTSTDPLGQTFLPLEIAVFRGHSGVVRELLRQLGVERCGGASGGVCALRMAAQEGDLDMMTILMDDGGVVDTGVALVAAAGYCGEAPVKFLLQRQRRRQPPGVDANNSSGGDYVNARDYTGKTAVVSGMLLCRQCAPRVVRMLIDAGADSASAVRLVTEEGVLFFHGTPLTLLKIHVGQKKKEDATEETLNILEAIRRLLLRVEAVHAASWLWHSSGIPAVSHEAAAGRAGTNKTAAAAVATATPMSRMMSILRRRASRRGVVLAPLFR